MLIAVLKTLSTDQLDWSLPAHRRGTLSGMDAAPEPPGTDSRRVLRWWAGKGPAANEQPSRFDESLIPNPESQPLRHPAPAPSAPAPANRGAPAA
ncbi:hypothetical protein DZD52_06625 [Xanthomonas nasturtii]|uniref:Uncharacterized protein n=1 Tax=Xanthomonas nasturtii TaxID=1843581 RepID=A0A3E1KNG9_9XANT|nr:hypothetical protein DZD52_06625 [Xanthomonas nasturtii]